MIKSSLPVALKTLMKYKDAGTLLFDNPVQRAKGQWNNLQMSMLIHSMLADYIVPNIYLSKEVKEGVSYLSVLDGLQRLSSVISFVEDEWILHPKTPNVIIDGVEYKLALKKFSELDEDLKSMILQYRFGTYQLENVTDAEIEETFARLNAGTSLSKIQTARPKLGVALADFFNKLTQHDFFQKALNLTLAQLRKEDDFLMLITTAMLLEDFYYGEFQIKTSASAAECVRFAEAIKDNYSQDKKDTLELLVDYLDEAFSGSEYKFLRKNNIPIVMYIGLVCLNKGISAKEYEEGVVDFFENEPEKYTEASGVGNVKLIKVKARIRILLDYFFDEYPDKFEDDDSIPISFIKAKESEDSGEEIEDTVEPEDTIDSEAEDSGEEDSSEEREDSNLPDESE